MPKTVIKMTYRTALSPQFVEAMKTMTKTCLDAYGAKQGLKLLNQIDTHFINYAKKLKELEDKMGIQVRGDLKTMDVHSVQDYLVRKYGTKTEEGLPTTKGMTEDNKAKYLHEKSEFETSYKSIYMPLINSLLDTEVEMTIGSKLTSDNYKLAQDEKGNFMLKKRDADLLSDFFDLDGLYPEKE